MNPNIKTALIFVSSLAQAGLKTVAISPGSRSTPLTLAFEANPDIEVVLHLDERSAAFFALGRALATNRPVALVCTSGTAAANYFPAIIEAYMSHVPLLVLTSDRPHELRHSGANQTIDQVKMFGDHVLDAFDLSVPVGDAPDLVWRNVATTAMRAYGTANGLRKGAVQLNFPFRKPLQPADPQEWLTVRQQLAQPAAISQQTAQAVGTLLPAREQIEQLTTLINQHERGIIVCGPRCPEDRFGTAVASLARACGYPIFADPISNVRFGEHTTEAVIVSGYETWLTAGRTPEWEAPDVVIRFGAVPTSKWLNDYLQQIDPAVRLHVRASGVWADDTHLTKEFWQVDEIALCQLSQSLLARKPGAWIEQVRQWEHRNWERLAAVIPDESFDIPLFLEAFRQFPDKANIFVGNSLPIRHFDQFCRAQNKAWRVFANRGASGIDGVVSSALGMATAEPDTPAFLLIGDISFFHDMNGLLLAKEAPNLTILLFNNDGGGIFNRLPIAQFERPFQKLFTTQHGLDYRHTAALYGLHYVRVETVAGLSNALAHNSPDQARLIELFSDNGRDETLRQALIKRFLAS